MLFLFFAVASCQKDELFSTPATIKSSSTVKVVDITGADVKTNPMLVKKLEELQDGSVKGEGRNVYIGEYDFTVITDYGKYIEKGDYHSYTFLVAREENNGLIENLTLSLEVDSTYSAVLVKYDLTEQQITKIQNKEEITGDIHIVETVSLDGDFSEILTSKVIYQAGGCLQLVDITVTINDTCDYVYTFSFEDTCGDGDGGSPGGDGGDGGTDGGSSGDGGGGASGGSGDDGGDPPPEDCHGANCGQELILTTPVVEPAPFPCEELTDLFNSPGADIKPVILALQGSIAQNGEDGTVFKKDNNGNYDTDDLNATQSNAIEIPYGNDDPAIYGAVHTHPTSTYPMFSFSDIFNLMRLHSTASATNKNEVVFMLVCKNESGNDQVYALKIYNFNAFRSKVLTAINTGFPVGTPLINRIETLNDKLRDIYEMMDDNGQTDQMKYEWGFMHFFWDYDIALARADANLTSWTKIVGQDPENGGIPLEIPCP